MAAAKKTSQAEEKATTSAEGVEVSTDGPTIVEGAAPEAKAPCLKCAAFGYRPCSVDCFVAAGYKADDYESFIANCEARRTKMADEAKAPRVTMRVDHPVAAAWQLLLDARALLVEARAMRPKDDDATADAGELAAAILASGGTVADPENPWPLKHALERPSGMPDVDGTETFAQFVNVCVAAMFATRRSQALEIGPHPALVRFAEVASKHKARHKAIEEIDERRRVDHAAREDAAKQTIERARAARAAKPAASAGARPVLPDHVAPVEEEAKV